MCRSVFTFMLIPLLGGVLASILFLMQGGFGAGHGRFDPVIGFCEMPSILLLMPASELLPVPRIIEEDDFLLVIVFPTLMNIGLFVLAGFVSWIGFPFPRIDSLGDSALPGRTAR
jgi:hypothetical protein